MSHLEVPHSWLPLCPHTFPSPRPECPGQARLPSRLFFTFSSWTRFTGHTESKREDQEPRRWAAGRRALPPGGPAGR